MQRCPYIHEMKERLLGTGENDQRTPRIVPAEPRDQTRDRILEVVQDPQVGTIVKVSAFTPALVVYRTVFIQITVLILNLLDGFKVLFT